MYFFEQIFMKSVNFWASTAFNDIYAVKFVDINFYCNAS